MRVLGLDAEGRISKVSRWSDPEEDMPESLPCLPHVMQKAQSGGASLQMLCVWDDRSG